MNKAEEVRIIKYEDIMNATKRDEVIVPTDEEIHAFALSLFEDVV